MHERDELPWNAQAAELLRSLCQLSGKPLARNLRWWKLLRERGVADDDIAAAVRGVPRMMRVQDGWWPCKVLGKRTNAALWLEAVSAGRRERRIRSSEASEPTPMGDTVQRLAVRLGL